MDDQPLAMPTIDAATAAQPFDDGLRTVVAMKAEALASETKDPRGSFVLRKALRSIRDQNIKTLQARLATTDDLLTMWALHREMDKRGVPPCLRARAPTRPAQYAFLETLADVLWVARRTQDHPVLHGRLRGVFRYSPASDQWHKSALWMYRQCMGKSHLIALRLALTDEERLLTQTMPTRAQFRDRRRLHVQLPEINEQLQERAQMYPDKSGVHSAVMIGDRRAELLRVYVLVGRDKSATVRYLRIIDGPDISRQSLARQLDAIAMVPMADKLIQKHKRTVVVAD
jgi:hypothetical protein